MKVERYPNLTGYRGTERTVSQMRRLVELGKQDPKVVIFAGQLVKGVDRNNWAGMARAIFNWVHDNISYVRDPIGVEYVQEAGVTLKTKTGDCDDQSVLFSTLAEAVGMKTRFVTVKGDTSYPDEFTHVYSEVEIPGKGWVGADTIVPKATLGWSANWLPSKRWGGAQVGFLTHKQVAGMGEVIFAAGQESEPTEDATSAMGGGNMWDSEPLLASEQEKLDDEAGPDFWGGTSDTEPGPGFLSKALPSGLGQAQNLLYPRQRVQRRIRQVRPVAQVRMSPMSGMGDAGLGINIFKKLGKAISSGVKKLGENINKGVEKLGENFKKVGDDIAKGIGLSTPETRDKAARNAVEAALGPAWNSDGIQYGVELLRRIDDTVAALQAGKPPQYIQGPPVGMAGFARGLGADAITQIATQAAMSTPWGQGVAMASNLIKGLGQAEDQKAANEAVEKYVNAFPSDQLNKALQDAATAFATAGGILPQAGQKPPSDFLASYQSAAVAGAADKGGRTGYSYYYLQKLLADLQASISKVQSARQLLQAAYKGAVATSGAQAVQAAAQVVQNAMQSGTVAPAQAQQAMDVATQMAQGYALPPQAQELAQKIVAGQPSGGGGTGLLVAAGAAIAAAAALL